MEDYNFIRHVNSHFTAQGITLHDTQSITLQDAPPCPDPYGIHAYAHPEDCGAFFLCTNGTLTFEYCENGLLFDGHGAVHNHCNYNWAVNCGNRKADCKYHAAFTIFESLII